MPRIKIIRTPPGEAPEAIRKAWIGLCLPTRQTESQFFHHAGVLSGEYGGTAKAYAVPRKQAIAILKISNSEAAAWWEQNTSPHWSSQAEDYVFLFDDSACHMLPSLSNLERNLESILNVMVEESLPALALIMANHTLWCWVEMHGMLDYDFKPEDIGKIEPFWGLLRTYGIGLTDEEKKEVFINFIED